MRNLPASISRPTTPPQAFQPPPPVPPLSTLPPAEAEELRQLRLQFQQQQAAHHLQQQALLHSSFSPFFSPFQLYFPPPSLPLRHRALHQPQSLHRRQNQRQLNQNLSTFPFPSSHLRFHPASGFHPGGIDPSISRWRPETPTIVSPMVSAQT